MAVCIFGTAQTLFARPGGAGSQQCQHPNIGYHWDCGGCCCSIWYDPYTQSWQPACDCTCGPGSWR
jgi:hypothetical protein